MEFWSLFWLRDGHSVLDNEIQVNTWEILRKILLPVIGELKKNISLILPLHSPF